MGNYGIFDDLCRIRDYKSKRSSSWDTTGKNNDSISIKTKQKVTILDEQGAGCIKHIYWTYICEDAVFGFNKFLTRNNIFRGVVLRVFWDNSKIPSIEVPLGDFFGISNCFIREIKSLAFVTNPGFNRLTQASYGFNCYLPMPFSSGVRIELENQGPFEASIYFHIDYEVFDDKESRNIDEGRFHAVWNRENPTKAENMIGDANLTGNENYIIADIQGNGQFAGYFLTVVNEIPNWYGEGDDMIFIDGEQFPPSIHGTGTEEIFGGGACPDKEYSGPYTGFHCIENKGGYRWFGTNGMYRFFIQDPIRFKKSIIVSIEHGHANNLSNEYISTAFWYQKGINENLPKLANVDDRQIELFE